MIQTKENEPIVQMKGICKYFGGVHAIEDVDLSLYAGEILAIVGDNGAGKSTLIKILSGAYAADKGEILVNGKKVEIMSTIDSRNLGIETLYQNLALADNMNLFENIFLGREIKREGLLGRLGVINSKLMIKEGLDLIDRFQITIPNPEKKVRYLSGGQRQIVATCRAIYFNAQIIIMDEPTAALGVAETKRVYDFINALKERRISIIIISHNINEVYDIADRVMVLKTGRLVCIVNKNETSINEIVRMIISGHK